jgi:hypothetical protein
MSRLPTGLIGLVLLAGGSPSIAQYISGPQWLEDLPPVDGTIYSVGTWDPDGAGLTPPLLIVGGAFSTAGGVPANNIATFDGTAWSPLGSGVNRTPRAYTLYQGDLIVAGEFTFAGDTTANYVARWDGVNWSPLGDGLNMYVFSLAVYNDELYAGGWFDVNGAQSIARWDGTTWVPVGGGVAIADCPYWCGTSVNALAVYNGELVAGGYFTTAGGLSTRYIARWNGSHWTSPGGGLDNEVSALAVYNNQLIVGGWFTRAYNGALIANRIIAWNGSSWSALGGGLDGTPMGLAINNGRLFAGGTIIQPFGGYVSEWNGSFWSALGSGMDSTVGDLTAYHGDIVAVGNFTTADGIPSLHWARWRDLPPPQITQGPTFQMAFVGQDVHFTVAASSPAGLPLQYQWRKSGVDLADDAHFSGTNTPQLTISSVQLADTASYGVVVTDCKSATVYTSLYVTCPLAVSAPTPAFPKSVYVGETATTSVAVSGAIGAPRFSWRKNGVALTDDFHISGSASPTLTISPAGRSDYGSYTVVVTDDCGNVTSAATSLAVLCPGTVPADLDGDCDVDPSDLDTFLSCASGPAVPAVIGPACPRSRTNQTHAVADLDIDGDVDQEDFGVFQRCFSGVNQPPLPGCAH